MDKEYIKMFNVFALILAIFTFFSGLFWMIKYINKGDCVCSFFRSILNKYLPRCNFLKKIKIVVYLKKICCYCMRWIFEVCVSIFPILFCIFIMRSFLFEPFQIPSGSMMPTLLSGDFILVNKFCYGIKNPITQNTLVEIGHPRRGDIVVFKYPLNTKLDYIKRVVGLPGDRVIYNSLSKKLVIYSKCNSKSDHIHHPVSITYTNIYPSNFVQIFNVNHGEIISDFYHLPSEAKVDNGIRLMQSVESFDGAMHNILTIIAPGAYNCSVETYNKEQLGEFLSEWIVPVGEYFMLGDNRDNSADSRYWGFVPEKNIVGKAIAIWMSFEKQNEGTWPIIFRFHRIGKIC